MARADDRILRCGRASMTRRGLEVRRTSALLLPSILAAALCAGCLNAGPEVQSVEASKIEGDLAGATNASSGVPFVAETQASGGSGYDADTVLSVRYEVNEDC